MEDSVLPPHHSDPAPAARPVSKPRKRRAEAESVTDEPATAPLTLHSEPPAPVPVRRHTVAVPAPAAPPPYCPAEMWYIRIQDAKAFSDLSSTMVRDGAAVRSRQYAPAEFMDHIAAPLKLCAAVMSAGSAPPASEHCELRGPVLVQIAAVITDGWHFALSGKPPATGSWNPPVHYRLLQGKDMVRLIATPDPIAAGVAPPSRTTGALVHPGYDRVFGAMPDIPGALRELLDYSNKDTRAPCMLAVRTHAEGNILRELDIVLFVFDVKGRIVSMADAAPSGAHNVHGDDPLAGGMAVDADDDHADTSDAMLRELPTETHAGIFYSVFTKARKRMPAVYARPTRCTVVKAS